MSSLDDIKKSERHIAEQTAKQFPAILKLFDDGLSLLVDATGILEGGSGSIEHHTQDGAAQAAASRFLSTLPMSATCCFHIALAGNYGIAKHILRLALEETVKLGYYVTFPEQAFRQITLDRDNDRVTLGDMLRQLDPDNRQGLMELHGHLSALYSHASLNLPHELLLMEDGSPPLIAGGPRFMPDVFEPLAHQLLILIANAIKFAWVPFPSLLDNVDWATRALAFLESVIRLTGLEPRTSHDEGYSSAA